MAGNLDTQVLKHFVLFEDLTPGQLARVASISTERKVRKHATIFVEGDKGDCIILIVSGIIKISRSSSDGRVTTLALLGAKDFFGEMALFLPRRERSATAEALTDCRLVTINQNDFERILKEVPGITMRMIQTLVQRILVADRQIKTLALGDSRAKLSDLLLRLKDDFPVSSSGDPVIGLTHQELADLAGISRETATRLLNQFEADGLVRLRSRQVVVIGITALRKLSG